MNKIGPRWEWRAFGSQFPDEEAQIRQYDITSTRESTELYIISIHSNDNTKIRDELMDIKTPLRISQDGLEKWTVVMKAGFPIHINELALVYKAWGIPIPYLDKDEYSYQEYLNKLIIENTDLRTVEVNKTRHGYLINEVIVEIADVSFNSTPLRTIAVEHADPDKVIDIINRLGLRKYENTNYIKAIKRLLNIPYDMRS
ncbi:MAG: hypothetical protein JW784_00400 [Candidatus Cloacimonetes bacterium]|nr:hypothetical protein [Candidatus Cloacimonadota bacterium]